MKVLVLDAHTRAGLEVAQSLARQGIVVDVAAENDCLAFRSRRVHASFRQPSAGQTTCFLQWLKGIDQENSYAMIVPSAEVSLHPFLFLPESDLLRKKAVLPSNVSLRIALDKFLTLRAASKLQIPTPETILIQSGGTVPACNFYPAILKPVTSQIFVAGTFEGVHAQIVQNEYERQEQLRGMLQKAAVLQQELVSGRGVAIEMLYRHGQLVWYFCHERLHEGSGAAGIGSGSTYRRSIEPNPEMFRHSKALLDDLGWHGAAQVEFKVADDGRFWLMEINPRLWGSLALAIDAGMDFPFGLLCLALDQQVPKQPQYKIHQYTRYLVGDLDWLKTRFRYRLDIAAWTEALKLLRPIVGLESWDYFDWGDLSTTFIDLRSFFGQKRRSAEEKIARARQSKAAHRLHTHNLSRILASGQKPQKVLFLCYGNICRSPFSELLMKARFPELHVCSAGFHKTAGRTSPSNVQQVARTYSVDLSRWSS